MRSSARDYKKITENFFIEMFQSMTADELFANFDDFCELDQGQLRRRSQK